MPWKGSPGIGMRKTNWEIKAAVGVGGFKGKKPMIAWQKSAGRGSFASMSFSSVDRSIAF